MNLLHRISNWYFTQKALPYWCVLVLDCILVAFSGYIGYCINLGWDTFADSLVPITLALLISMVT